jgi:hypothetical protein
MLKAIASTVLALLLGLCLTGPVASDDDARPPGDKDSDERFDYCVEEAEICSWGCFNDFGHLPREGAFWSTCEEACGAEYGACQDAERGVRIGVTFFDFSESPGVLDSPPRQGAHTVPIGNLGIAEVERVCSRVHGIFDHTADFFGCINRQCDDKGSCVILCKGGNCLAITPDKLPGRFTLLGILQNGDNVDRKPPALSPDSPDDDDVVGCGQNCG